MATAGASADVGALLKRWREQRRLTQMELALDAGVSARHLSFVETGRSKPGREMLLGVTERLEVPYRERNEILLGAGHAPAFPERPLDDPSLAPVREALDKILAAHDPYPAIAFDRSWNVVAANASMMSLAALVEIDPSLLEPPINLLRTGFHPRGFAPLIVNLDHWRSHFFRRLERQIHVTGDDSLRELLEELQAYPGGGRATGPTTPNDFLGPVRVHAPDGGQWSFFGMFAGFDTPFEVTTSELALELLFPADEGTERALRKGVE